MTARDLINGSLRLLGVLAEGEPANASQAQDALASLNSLLDSWSTESLTVMGLTQRIVTLTNSQQVYTIGPGGDINIARPTVIQDISSVYPSGPNQVFLPMREYTVDEYDAISVLGFTTPIPLGYYINYDYPLNQLFMYPLPLAGTQLRFWTQDALASIASLDAILSLAPGYEKAIRYNLAIELAPEYERSPASVVVANAQIAKENIQRGNMQDLVVGCGDFAMTGQRYSGFNRITGGTS